MTFAPGREPLPSPAMTTAKPPTIPDPGLFLGVLQALLEQEVVSQDRLDAVLADIETSDVEEGEEWERVSAAIALLHALPISADELARVERLDFDGGNEIYMLLEELLDIETGGESDYYEVQSLAGISALRSLVDLNLDAYGFRTATLDLTPLAGHPTIASLYLTGKCKPATTLEAMPALKRLRARPDDLDDPAVLARLRARGVEVIEQ